MIKKNIYINVVIFFLLSFIFNFFIINNNNNIVLANEKTTKNNIQTSKQQTNYQKAPNINKLAIVFFNDLNNINGLGSYSTISFKKFNSIIGNNNFLYKTETNIDIKKKTGFTIFNMSTNNNNKINLDLLEKDDNNARGFIGYKIFISNFSFNNSMSRIFFDENIINNKLSATSYNQKTKRNIDMISKYNLGSYHIDMKVEKVFILKLNKQDVSDNKYVAFYLVK